MYKVEENPVKIKTLSVGKLKFTKTLFNQVISRNPFNTNLEFKGESYFGFVKADGGRHLIWIYEGQLRSWSLGDLIGVSKIHEQTRLDSIDKRFFQNLGLQVDLAEDSTGTKFPHLEMDKKSEERLSLLITNANKFLAEIANHQIFL